jgi:hypothetical protein
MGSLVKRPESDFWDTNYSEPDETTCKKVKGRLRILRQEARL